MAVQKYANTRERQNGQRGDERQCGRRVCHVTVDGPNGLILAAPLFDLNGLNDGDLLSQELVNRGSHIDFSHFLLAGLLEFGRVVDRREVVDEAFLCLRDQALLRSTVRLY